MHYSGDRPESDWPHDMVLAICPNEHVLGELLFLRATRGWDVASWLPAADPRPMPTEAGGLSEHWEEWWSAAVAWTAKSDTRGHDLAAVTGPEGITDRTAFELLMPPRLPPDVAASIDREALAAWESGLPEYTGLPLEQTPERRAVAPLAAAWRAGLTTIIVIPVSGEYSATVAANALLVSHATYADPELFAAALLAFRTG